MKNKPTLITGGCGFVGRHLTKSLIERGYREIWIIDNIALESAHRPHSWLSARWQESSEGDALMYKKDDVSIRFLERDALEVFATQPAGEFPQFGDVFHLASIVGGRTLIDGDPLLVARDLGIDAALFLWLSRDSMRAERVLYASSSAAYPTRLQGESGAVALKESFIEFSGGTLGQPDMTYGWAKLTGEYLAKLAHEKYGMHVACVRPFSGYGEDQDLTYPTPSIALRVARGDDPIEVWGTGTQGRDFVHIDDCVDAFFAVLEKVSDGSAINIGTGTPTTFIELIERMLTLEGRAAGIKPLSDKPVGVTTRYADTTMMDERVQWQPKISLDEGLRRVLDGARQRLAGNPLPFCIV